MTDMFNLQQLMQSLNAGSLGGLRSGDGFPRPSAETGRAEDDTTANVYSLLIARRVVSPEALVSPLDQAWVEVATDYDWGSWQGSDDPPWDQRFSADLEDVSNVSYAHLVLYGDRDVHWSTRRLDSAMPIFSSRGPQDGIEDTDSLTCDPATGRWSGHVVFGDGHVELINGAGDAVRRGRGGEDHYFRIDDEDRHRDAILGFTSEMTSDGPILQWD